MAADANAPGCRRQCRCGASPCWQEATGDDRARCEARRQDLARRDAITELPPEAASDGQGRSIRELDDVLAGRADGHRPDALEIDERRAVDAYEARWVEACLE